MTYKDRSRFAICMPLLLVLIFVSTAHAAWKEKVLYSFQGGNDGSIPAGGVVFDSQGNLYGTTHAGGPPTCAPIGNYCGTVYQLKPPAKPGGAWTKTQLYMFKGKRSNDGEVPGGGLVRDAAGNLYGVTAYGGKGGCVLVGVPAGCGTVYELSPPKTKGGKWAYKILYSFKSGKDGYLPGGDLVFDAAGNLYGSTDFGGGKGVTCNPDYPFCGTVFELSPPTTKGGKWTEKVLHRFAGGFADGGNPNGGLVLDSKGNVYGATAGGGGTGCQGPGCGTLFELKQPAKTNGAWNEKMLHRFTGGDDGAGPNGGLILDAKGALYGTAGGGGTGGLGVVFQLTHKPSGHWVEKVLHDFTLDKGGRNPAAGVTFDSTGILYGTAHAAASDKFGGIVFGLKPVEHGKAPYSVLYNFAGAPDGAYPTSTLVFGKDGRLYSTTEGGGTGQSCPGGCGAVFSLKP